ncbi:MAG: DUF3460 family protein [Oxalobacteraceae bacterium]|jgi:hypothetical protein|nr:DUF3460 family protein [Oxalobacteraceae bacterium]
MFKKKNGYVSEFTQFLAEMKNQDPAIEEGQRSGRARLWDKEPTDLDSQRRLQESRVKQQAYVYQQH